MNDYHIKAHELLGPKPLVQDEADYVRQVRHIALALEQHFNGGELSMKEKFTNLIRGCLDRDPSLQKIAKAVDEL